MSAAQDDAERVVGEWPGGAELWSGVDSAGSRSALPPTVAWSMTALGGSALAAGAVTLLLVADVAGSTGGIATPAADQDAAAILAMLALMVLVPGMLLYAATGFLVWRGHPAGRRLGMLLSLASTAGLAVPVFVPAVVLGLVSAGLLWLPGSQEWFGAGSEGGQGISPRSGSPGSSTSFPA